MKTLHQQAKGNMVKSVIFQSKSTYLKFCQSKQQFFDKKHAKYNKTIASQIINKQNDKIIALEKHLRSESDVGNKFFKKPLRKTSDTDQPLQFNKYKHRTRVSALQETKQNHKRHRLSLFQNLISSNLEILRKQKTKIDNFVLLAKIGQGTYSIVYKAIHKLTNMMVALKIISKQKIKHLKLQENIIRQIKVQFFLNHRNIVQLYGYFHDEEHIYLITEFCTDGTCYSKIKDNNKYINQNNQNFSQSAKIIKQLTEGIAYMHDHDIMHRDIKPQNVLLTFDNHLKICDFGWAVHNPNNVLRNTACGTPLYLAPQRIQQIQYTQSIDVWAIGIFAYELLTGQIPFNVTQIRQLDKIVKQEANLEALTNNTVKSFIELALRKEHKNRASINQLLFHSFLHATL